MTPDLAYVANVSFVSIMARTLSRLIVKLFCLAQLFSCMW